jgi:ATP/ADP translocase
MFFKSIFASKYIKIIFFLIFFYIFDINTLKPSEIKKKKDHQFDVFQAIRTFETQFQTQYQTGIYVMQVTRGSHLF